MTTITLPRAVVQQALDAMSRLRGDGEDAWDMRVTAITNLFAALDQPQAEPAAAQPSTPLRGQDVGVAFEAWAKARYPLFGQHHSYTNALIEEAWLAWKTAAALEQPQAEPAPAPTHEPLILLHCGQIDSDGEQDDWDIEPDSGDRVDAFAALHPGKTIPLYPHPAPAAPSADAAQEQEDEAAARFHDRLLNDAAKAVALLREARDALVGMGVFGTLMVRIDAALKGTTP